ncbi:MAG: hypothetical protein FJY81_00340 [Candidatus Aminicenantes bacterium]|nr:hypothetical protein [Candidatus Aminicenantes bacterium]
MPLRRNIILVFGVLGAQGLHLLAMHLPFMQNALRVAPVTIKEWAALFALALIVLAAMEIFKVARKKWFSG